jgi:chromate transporter
MTEENNSRPGIKVYLNIFSTMFVVGLFTFGGGLSMLPQMKRVFVEKRRWITEEEIIDIFAVSQSLPGVIASNTAVMVGHRIAGVPGGLVSALGVVLPSFLVLLPVTLFYRAFIDNPVMLGVLRGIRAAVTALLLYTVWGLRKGSLRGVADLLLCGVAAVLVLLLGVNPVWVILGGLLFGAGRAVVRARKGGAD